ncbi:MAG: cupin domain-containing protein [Candidatus Acidiferrales bacterium]
MLSFREVRRGAAILAMTLGLAFAGTCVGGTDFAAGHASRVASARAQTGKLNPAALVYKLPNQIHWTDDPIGAKTAVLAGDPSKPGLYVMLVKWTPHHMSHPHWHPNDRFITVLSGTWWVGTGTKFDPDNTVPMPTGTFVKHFGKQVHYDGAKDEEAVLEIVGEGPDTATPAKGQ